MPTNLDLAFTVLFTVIVTLVETFYFFPQFKAAVLKGVRNARWHGYRRTIAGQWLFAAATVAIWAGTGRSWTQLGLVPPTGGRMYVSIALLAIMLYLAVRQTRAIARLGPERRVALRSKLESLDYLLPHTRREYRWFTALSFTAGFCEELLYRGYLMWVLGAYIGVAGAIAASFVLFGAGHIYQGPRGALKAAAVGLVMNLIVLATGWLIPAMVIHALIDASAGMLGVAVLRESNDEPAAAPRVEASIAASA